MGYTIQELDRKLEFVWLGYLKEFCYDQQSWLGKAYLLSNQFYQQTAVTTNLALYAYLSLSLTNSKETRYL